MALQRVVRLAPRWVQAGLALLWVVGWALGRMSAPGGGTVAGSTMISVTGLQVD